MPLPALSSRGPTMRSIARCACIVLAAPALALAGCSGKAEGEQGRPPANVGFIVAKSGPVPIEATLAGRTVAVETSQVRPQVTGVIRKRFFKEGAFVRAGQPLFQIDASLYQASVAQASANLASARATADAAVARADRFRPLAEIEAVARQDYVDAAAQARVARAAVAQNAAALDTARINLRFTTVPAPISGRIGRSLATVGALASANQPEPLAVIQRTDVIYVDLQQSAADLTALRRRLAQGGVQPASAAVRLRFDDGSFYPVTGTIQFSEVTVNESTGTVTLRARFANPDGALLPGMFVTAVFDQAIAPAAFLVPQSAVQRDFDGSAFVMVVGKDDKAERRKVAAETSRGSDFVVTSGLRNGDRIILQGLNGLRSGTKVVPVPANAPQNIAPPPAGAGR